MLRVGVPLQDTQSYFYIGLGGGIGYASLKDKFLRLFCGMGLTYSKAGIMPGLLVGRQWMQYLATELVLEVLKSLGERRRGLWSSEYIAPDVSFYTFGGALDFIPMLPVLDWLSLFMIAGIGCKKAVIEVREEKIPDLVGWRFIPRLGLGVILSDSDKLRSSLKLLVECNNRFKNGNQSLFQPSVLFCANLAINFR